MFLVPQDPKKYILGPSRFFGIHLVPQVSKPDKFGPKPDFDPVDRVWPPQNRPMNNKFELLENKSSKKSGIFGVKYAYVRKVRPNFRGLSAVEELVAKKEKYLRPMNSKFENKIRKIQKILKFIGV